MVGYTPIYSQTHTILNIEYEVYSCCNGERLLLVIAPLNIPHNTSCFDSLTNFSVSMTRDIDHGLVDWYKGDRELKHFLPLLKIADNIALETEKLLKRAYDMRVFL